MYSYHQIMLDKIPEAQVPWSLFKAVPLKQTAESVVVINMENGGKPASPSHGSSPRPRALLEAAIRIQKQDKVFNGQETSCTIGAVAQPAQHFAELGAPTWPCSKVNVSRERATRTNILPSPSRLTTSSESHSRLHTPQVDIKRYKKSDSVITLSTMGDEIRLMNFINNIPQGVNPYDATIGYLAEATSPPTLPHWARIALRFFLGCYAFMWLQSFYLLYVRFKTRTFRLITVTRLGLWRVDVPNMSGLAYFLYPPLVIADLTLQQKIDEGGRDLTDKVPLLASFIWVCACQCVSNYWDDQWPESSRHGRTVPLPRYVVITMNTLFVCVLTWIIPCVIILTTQSNEEYKKIRHILGEILVVLKDYSSKFDPDTYQASRLIAALMPAREILVHEENMARYLRTALIIGLANLLLLCLLYAPLLKNSIGAIQRRTEECTFAVAISPFDQSEQFAHIKHRVRQEYWTSFIHGLAVYMTSLALVPILIWQVSFPGPEYMRSRTWLTVTQIGMHGPFALSGNAIELLLNLQARRLLDLYRIQKTASRSISRNGTSQLHLEVSSTESVNVTETAQQDPLCLDDKHMELKTTK
ncbi:hypothetical protein PSTG_02456 [Puccinia striiformis f. sp. tritici PST-78]|uniref:Uncharacterized protein n=2 Tax=Puccinia striiformis f. sp. tritici TaxID=168172 RepID=A0A0L0VZC3_9BASI|nr:hypothetical protein PSTG_02456 [Puccinia striiformis f. sp. tritici PST-78]